MFGGRRKSFRLEALKQPFVRIKIHLTALQLENHQLI